MGAFDRPREANSARKARAVARLEHFIYNKALRSMHILSSYTVPRCVRSSDSLYEWHNKSCKVLEGPGAGDLDQAARERGSALVSKITPGMWLLIEAYGDETDELYLARACPFFSQGGSRACTEKHSGGRRHIQGTRFDNGDFKIAVQWYERLAEDGNGERLEFQRGTVAVDLVNSTELRHCGFNVELIEEPRRPRRRDVRSGSCAGAASGSTPGSADPDEEIEGLRKWRLPREAEKEALQYCR